MFFGTSVLSVVVGVAQLLELNNPLLLRNVESLNLPIVIRVTDFDEGSARVFVDQMQEATTTGQSIIPVVIDSYGGSVYGLLTMMDAIKNSKVPVATIVVGKAMSAGAALLSCGAEGMRFSAPLATIMVHEVSSGTEGKLENMKTDMREVERLNSLVMSIMSTNIGKPKDYFQKLISDKGHTDIYLTPEEAMEMNLINKVKIPTLKTRILSSVVLE